MIPELTYEKFIAFHRNYYHPANSYIYLCGDMDMAQKLNGWTRNIWDNMTERTAMQTRP